MAESIRAVDVQCDTKQDIPHSPSSEADEVDEPHYHDRHRLLRSVSPACVWVTWVTPAKGGEIQPGIYMGLANRRTAHIAAINLW